MKDDPSSLRVAEEKQSLREAMRRRLAVLAPAARQEESRRIMARLLATTFWQEARRIALFSPTAQEPDLDAFWRDGHLAGKECFYPVVAGKSLHLYRVDDPAGLRPTPPWNLREPAVEGATPAALGEMDLVLVPGMAFDGEGGRLGRGGGYYDRLLAAREGRKPVLLGVGFGFQRVDLLPLAAHDVRLDAVVFS